MAGDVLGIAQWPLWTTQVRLVMTDPRLLTPARAIVDAELAAVERAASRFREDSELRRVGQAHGRPVRVSARFAGLVAVALAAAERTGGDVDPTVGGPLRELGYDRDLARVTNVGPATITIRSTVDWRRVRLDGRLLTVPDGVELDLGATAKAYAADRCARLVADRYPTGVLVSLGGDLATAGTAPTGGWRVTVQDTPDDPPCTVTLPSGAALATSSTAHRTWRRGEAVLHHVLDPRTCRPAPVVWRTVSVAANRCVDANTLTTAALVRGTAAPDWLRRLGAPARLVTRDRQVVTLNGWPG